MTNIVTWGAEAFDLGAGFDQEAGSSIDAAQARTGSSGTKSMKQTSAALNQRNQGYRENGARLADINYSSRFFNRWWQKFDSGFTWSNQNKYKTQRWTNEVVSPMTGYVNSTGVSPGEHNEGFTSDQGAGSGGEGPIISYNFPLGVWEEYIVDILIHSALDATDGHMRFYVNGVLTGTSLTGIRWWSGTLTGQKVGWAPWGGMFSYPQDCNGDFWIDDVSLDDVWNSTYVAASATLFPALKAMRRR